MNKCNKCNICVGEDDGDRACCNLCEKDITHCDGCGEIDGGDDPLDENENWICRPCLVKQKKLKKLQKKVVVVKPSKSLTIQCQCGSTFQTRGKTKHEKTNKHKNWLAEQDTIFAI